MVDDPAEASECCSCLTLAYTWNGHLTSAKDIIGERLEWAKLSHDPYQARHVYSWLALFTALQGKFTEAEQWLIQAEAALAPLASSEPRAFLHHVRGWLAYTRGDYAAAEEHFSLAVELFRELGPGALVWYLAPLGLAQLLQGKRHEAASCINEVETLLTSQQEGVMVVADALSKLALMALWLHDRERVAAYYPRLLPFQGRGMEFLLDRVGSGSHEHGSPFQVVAMEKEAQTNIMHHQRCARTRAFCERNEPNVAARCYSSARARAVSPVSFPTAVCCSSGMTA